MITKIFQMQKQFEQLLRKIFNLEDLDILLIHFKKLDNISFSFCKNLNNYIIKFWMIVQKL